MSDTSVPGAELSPVKRALLEIRRLRSQLAERQPLDAEPVAIIGMAVRLPGGIVRLEDFWQLLAAGKHAIGEVPPERWDAAALFDVDPDKPGKTYSRHGGFLPDIDRFDAAFFGITPREAESMDPQQRILLELTWEALEHASVAPTSLAGSSAGAFIGLSYSDYGRLLIANAQDIDAYASFGSAVSIVAGRICYVLDARGPSLVVDTACSSSLTAIHLACRSLRAGETNLAIVGAANLMLTSEATVSFSHARMLAPDGQCKTFDATADGYVRGEGCAVVVMKRLCDAQAAGDRVLAVVRGSAINHDGRSAGLTAPNGPAQEAVIRAALKDAQMAPGDVDYVEAHGTGTPLGDPIELQALGAAYGRDRSADRPLLVGSVKTNLGHLEATAGLAGLVKTVLSLQHEALPPHRNFSTPNPHVDWAELPVEVVRSLQPWRRSERPRRAGLSAFGFSGTNVHLVIEEAPLAADRAVALPTGRPELFLLSARSTAALRALTGRYVEWLDLSDAALADICFTAAAGRAHHPHRLAVVANDRRELAQTLRAWLADDTTGLLLAGGTTEPLLAAVADTSAPQLGFFCPATIASAEAFADALKSASPAFAKSWAALPETPVPSVALQCALARFWTSMGLVPAAAFGVGSGEIAAATIATGPIAFVSSRTGRIETTRLEHPAGSQQPHRLEAAEEAVLGAGAERLLVLGLPSADAGERRIAVLGATPETAWTGILQALRTLYLAGVDLDWAALYQGEGRHKLTLPSYQFQRHRFWRPATRHAAAEIDWPKLIAAAALQSQSGPLGWNIGNYDLRWRRCDALTAGNAVNTLDTLGAFAQPGARATPDQLIHRHGLVPLYRDLLWRWLGLLTREDVLRAEGDAFVSTARLQRRDLSDLWREVEQLMAEEPDVLAYARRTAAKLPELLTGRINPLEILFPRGSLDTAHGIYEHSPASRYLNAIVAAGLRALLEAHPGGTFRLVEVGGGTGGTTALLAPGFPSDGEYWFTDLSDVFLTRARARFDKNPAFRFTKFDLEQPIPTALPVGHVDVVVAANVVHATKDVGVTLDRLRALLKPGGVMLLVENTTHHSLFDLSIAFVEGWSSFSDQYRTRHPLLDADRWTALLKERGFVEAERFPATGSAADNTGAHVVIGRNSLEAPQATLASPACPKSTPVSVPLAAPALPPAFLESTDPQERRELLAKFVRRSAAQVMHLDPETAPGPRERFTDLGMDSLMALQLKTELARGLGLDEEQLPATIAFDSGTVEELTDQILKLTGTSSDALVEGDTPRLVPVAPDHLTEQDLDALSDADVEALLAQRVRANPTLVEP